MEFVRHVARIINFKYLLIAVAAAVLLYAMTSPLVIDPLIGFLLAGIIPGTDIVMAPETVLMILTDIFGLAVAALLIAWVVRRRLLSDDIDYTKAAKESQTVQEAGLLIKATKRMHTSAAIHKAERQSARAVRPLQASATPRALRRTSTRAVDYPVLHLFATSLSTLGWLVAAGVLTVTEHVVRAIIAICKTVLFVIGIALLLVHYLLALMLAGAAQIGRLFAAGFRIVIKYGIWAAVFMIVVLGTIIDQSIRFAKFTAHKLKPFLQAFDSWLEIQFRKVSARLAKSYHRNETMQVFVMVAKDTIAGVQRFFK